MKYVTYTAIVEQNLVHDASRVTNPDLFKWEKRGEVYFPIDFNVLPISVFKFPLGDCTAGGISSNTDTVYIPCEDAPWLALSVDQSLILLPEQRGPNYWALKPAGIRKNMNGPMAGGNLAYCSDSRCKHVYHIHDRFEEWKG